MQHLYAGTYTPLSCVRGLRLVNKPPKILIGVIVTSFLKLPADNDFEYLHDSLLILLKHFLK